MNNILTNKKNRALENIKKSRDFLLNIIFPIECLSCGKEGKWLCQKCFRQLEYQHQHYCLFCKKETIIGETCLQCRKNNFIDGVLIAGNYKNKIIAKSIKNLKYRFAKGIAEFLGEFLILFLRNTLNKNKINNFNNKTNYDIFNNFHKTIIVPVPLHKKRFNWRGFNQSLELSFKIKEFFNIPISEKLICFKNKKPQAKLNAKKRKENIKGCFSWIGEDLNSKNILLIDDVATTGATLNECAKILKQAGAKEVWGLVIANG